MIAGLIILTSILQEAKDTKVLDVRIFRSYKGTGIAVLTCSYRIFMVNCIDDLRVRRLAEVPGTTLLTFISVLAEPFKNHVMSNILIVDLSTLKSLIYNVLSSFLLLIIENC